MNLTLGVVLACGLAWDPGVGPDVGASLQGTVHDSSGAVLSEGRSRDPERGNRSDPHGGSR